MKLLSSSVGAAFGTHHISPFILVGRLAQVKKSDPDFVCLRCQGTDADEKPITFCPRCGDRRTESVLRSCPKCELDLRTLLPQLSVWNEIQAPPLPAPALAPAGATGRSSAGAEASEARAPDLVQEAASLATAPAPSPIGEEALAEANRTALPTNATPPIGGWYPDPWNRFEVRYWDGQQWTVHVGTGGTTQIDGPTPGTP